MLHHHLSSLFHDAQQQQQQDHHQEEVLLSSATATHQMGFSSYPAHPSDANNPNFPLLVHPRNINNPFSLYTNSSSSSPNNPSHLSLHKSASNNWAWGEENDDDDDGGDDDHQSYHPLRISAMKMKKIKSSRRKVREPRFCFKTQSDVDVLDDGYKWRKYGQKVVKNTQHPRSYYRCSQDSCRVKKRVERLAEDPRMVITTYEGRHAHSPSHDLEDSDASHGLANFFW
uniref:WRKY domain-containing protein n=1 Tax=Kalanchoe fedtschenkoi TaxID=63787 RepID=A0A7N0UYR1_KALFE